MTKNLSPVFFEEEMVDPFSKNKDFLICAEHYMRYLYAGNLIGNNFPNSRAIVFDMSCGNGYGTSMLSTVSKEVIGFDVGKQYIKEADKKYKKSNTTYILSDFDDQNLFEFIRKKQLPFPDAIVSFETIEHLNNPEIFLDTVSKLLKKDKLLICSIPNGKYEEFDKGKLKSRFHKHIFYKHQSIEILKKHGFQIKSVLGQPFPNLLLKLPQNLINYLDQKAFQSKDMFIKYSKLIAQPIRFLNSFTYSIIYIAYKT